MDNFQGTCSIYSTEQFDALRRVCRCEQDMLRSLSRCTKWNASGGLFLKTRGNAFITSTVSIYSDSVPDEQFIAKEISRFEGYSFGEIGPAYLSIFLHASPPESVYKVVYGSPSF
jgi:1-phosphatidylinositol-3-phosphate 5-kinase